MGTRKRTSWREKLLVYKGLPRVQEITGKMSERWGSGTMVIPAPREVNELMAAVPKGRLTTTTLLRQQLAGRHGTNMCCPLTTGIFAWIAAHAAEEDRTEGKKSITPYWRTLKGNGELNPKYPGGIDAQKSLLEQEGHTIVSKGKKLYVAGYEDFLTR